MIHAIIGGLGLILGTIGFLRFMGNGGSRDGLILFGFGFLFLLIAAQGWL